MAGKTGTLIDRWHAGLRQSVAGSAGERLAAVIAAEIGSGMLPPGAVLPGVKRLAFELLIDESVVSSAYDQLRGQGLITTRADWQVCVAGTRESAHDDGVQGGTILPFSREGRPARKSGESE
jgi:DNA-binding transcriptional MocR family regulator